MSAFNSYVQQNSIIHRINPSLKFLAFTLLIIMVFIPTGLFGQIILLVVVLSIWFSSRLPFRLMKGILKSILIMAIILFLVNWATYKSPDMIVDCEGQYSLMFGNWQWIISNGWAKSFAPLDGSATYICVSGQIWGGQIGEFVTQDPTSETALIHYANEIHATTADGIKIYMGYNAPWYALSSQVLLVTSSICLKIFIMITIITLLTATTSSIQLAFAIEDILYPLKTIRIPVNEWAMTISIAIRFVPSLLDESQRILKAQASRGVDFSNGNFKDKIKSLISLVVPMFSIAFKKADDLANAMEARSYNPRYVRTRYRNYPVKTIDWFFFSLIAIIFGFIIMIVSKMIVIYPLFLTDIFLV